MACGPGAALAAWALLARAGGALREGTTWAPAWLNSPPASMAVAPQATTNERYALRIPSLPTFSDVGAHRAPPLAGGMLALTGDGRGGRATRPQAHVQRPL